MFRVNPSACSIHLCHVHRVNAGFCAGESLKRDRKRDKLQCDGSKSVAKHRGNASELIQIGGEGV